MYASEFLGAVGTVHIFCNPPINIPENHRKRRCGNHVTQKADILRRASECKLYFVCVLANDVAYKHACFHTSVWIFAVYIVNCNGIGTFTIVSRLSQIDLKMFLMRLSFPSILEVSISISWYSSSWSESKTEEPPDHLRLTLTYPKHLQVH